MALPWASKTDAAVSKPVFADLRLDLVRRSATRSVPA
jgi:hypothetical protein